MKKQMSLVVLAFAVGCGSATSDSDPVDSQCAGGKCDSAAELSVIPGELWASCELVPGEEGESLVDCQSFADGALVGVKNFHVEGRNDDNVIVASGFQDHAGEQNVPARIRHEDLPIDLRISLNLTDHNINGLNTTRATTLVRLTSPDEMSGDNRLLIEQPFDIWPLQVATTLSLYIIEAKTEVGEFIHPDGTPRRIPLQPAIIGREGPHSELIAVPRDATDLAVDVRWGDSLTEGASVLQGPGRYVVDNEGLRPASDADSALFDGAEPPIPEEPDEPAEPDEPGEPDEPVVPACTADYAGFLPVFEAGLRRDGAEAEAALADLECIPGDAAAYAGWHALFASQLDSFSPVNNGVLTQDERKLLDILLRAAPAATDEASYNTWHEHFAARLDAHVPASNGVLTADEAELLDIISSVRPNADSDGAYATWLQLYVARFEAYRPAQNGVLTNDERSVLDRVMAQRPGAGGATSYLAWFDTFTGYFDAFYPTNGNGVLTNDERTDLGVLRAARPETNAVEAYSAWVEDFAVLVEAAGSIVTDAERDVFDVHATAAPSCVDDLPSAQAAFESAGMGVTQSADLFAELAGPRSCDASE